MKRLITLLLSLFLIFNVVGVNCFGEDYNEPKQVETTNEEEVVKEEEIVVEDDNSEVIVESTLPEDVSTGKDTIVEENTGETPQINFGYIPSDLDYNTPVVSGSSSGIKRAPANIPSSYQSNIEELKTIYPDLRNQIPYGSCWTFATMGLMEFNLIKNNKVTKDIDLSELQLAHFVYNFVQDPLGGTVGDTAKYYNENTSTNYLNRGGNFEYSIRRLSQWISAANEEDAPYSSASEVLTNGLSDEYAYNKTNAYLKNAYIINIKANTDLVKRAIIQHGAVGVSYNHLDVGMNLTNNTYYDDNKNGGGHAVMIVGWDDNFSKENYTGPIKPTSDGAWLVRNSWGNYFSYFWMSYETVSLNDSAYVFDCSNEKPYDNNYQLDGGLESGLVTNASSVYNKFTVQKRDDIESETLKAVSFSITTKVNVDYTIDIYTSIYNPKKPEDSTKVSTISGKTTYPGLYTVELGTENEVNLKPGSNFYVVITTNEPAVDYEYAYSEVVDLNDPNSMLVWERNVSQYDYNSYCKVDGNTSYTPYRYNFRIKAFTNNNYKQVKKDITTTTITCKDAPYTGSEVEPEVTVTNELGVKLTKDKDYTLTYSNNINVGEDAKVTVTGINDYYGSKEIKFQIFNNLNTEFKGISLSLDGLINYNYYFKLPEELINDNGAYMLFTLPDGRTQKQYVKDVQSTSDGQRVFKCGVYSREMTKQIKAQLFNGKGEGDRAYYRSVEDYVNIVKNYSNFASVMPLLESMLNYGGYSQDLFNYNLNDKAYKNVKDKFTDKMNALTYDNFDDNKMILLSKDDNVSIKGLSLELKDGTTLRVYFDIKDLSKLDSSSITIDGNTTNLKQNSSGYYLEIEDIKSNMLNQYHTFKVGGTSVKACGLSYIYSSLKFNIAPDVSKALYLYHSESVKYFNKGA